MQVFWGLLSQIRVDLRQQTLVLSACVQARGQARGQAKVELPLHPSLPAFVSEPCAESLHLLVCIAAQCMQGLAEGVFHSIGRCLRVQVTSKDL